MLYIVSNDKIKLFNQWNDTSEDLYTTIDDSLYSKLYNGWLCIIGWYYHKQRERFTLLDW